MKTMSVHKGNTAVGHVGAGSGTRPARRKYFIDKSYQGVFLLTFSAILGLGALGTGAVTFFLAHSRLETQLYSSHLHYSNVGEVVLPVVICCGLVFIVIASVASLIATNLLFRRATKPLTRSINILNALAVDQRDQGHKHAGETRLIEENLIGQIAQGINQMAEAVSTRLDKLREASELSARPAAAIEEMLHSGQCSKASLDSLVSSLKEIERSLSEGLALFRTERSFESSTR